jgi:hypothetical protein
VIAPVASSFGAALLSGLASGQTPGRPDIIADAEDLAARIKTELRVTRPDHIVLVPGVKHGEMSDTGNEHFLAIDGPAGSLMAVWAQGSSEARPGQHLAFARSTDEGVTRTKLRIIAGPKKAGDGYVASRGYRLASRSGRIYVLYSQHIGKFDTFYDHTGWLHGIFSDDKGQTWSRPQEIPVARSIHDTRDLPPIPVSVPSSHRPTRRSERNTYGVIERRSRRRIPRSRTGRCCCHFRACSSSPPGDRRRDTVGSFRARAHGVG